MMELCDASEDQRRRTRLSFDPKTRFPSKLFDVANDGFLVKWNWDGTSVIVDEEVFEEKVMKSYPGFVQIASFPNLRRLFREYSFDWEIMDGTETVFQFSHPAFIRDREDLLNGIRTKRKSGRGLSLTSQNRYVRRLTEAYSPKECKKRQFRSRKYSAKETVESIDMFCKLSNLGEADSSLNLTAARSSSDSSQGTSSCYEYRGFTDVAETPTFQLYSSSDIFSSVDEYDSRPTQQDLMNVLAVYAKNELNEEEYLQLLAKTAIEDQITWNTDVARESISLQSVPSMSSEEYVPFDQTFKSPGFQQWEERKDFNYATDAAENQNQSYNDTLIAYERENEHIFPIHTEETAATASNDCEVMSHAYQQAHCENNELRDTEGITTLCELRPGLFDHSSMSDEMCHSQPLQTVSQFEYE